MQKVHAYLKKEYPRFLEELKEYVSLASVSASGDKKQMQKCAEWLLAHCRKIGLSATLYPTAGNPVLVATTKGSAAKKLHYIVYGHYDVQPPEPLELWKTPPFTPTIRGGKIFARGSSDNKGQHFAHLKAVEAYIKTYTPLPCDISFVIEGEEEVGSSNLSFFLKKNKKMLAADGVVISDTNMPSLKTPAITYALRGIAAFEITLRGPDRDVHSGSYGGSIENPALALAHLLATLRDKKTGKILVSGFYDGVCALSAKERKAMHEDDAGDAERYRAFLKVPCLFGEKGFSHIEHTTIRPTIEINGLTSGYQGIGSKTIVPSLAHAKITMRLVPHQEPQKVIAAVRKHLTTHCPTTVTMEIKNGHGAEPYFFEPTSAAVSAAERAIKRVFGAQPRFIREGGSIPVVTDFKKILGVHSLLIGLALPDDNAHSPNEKFELANFKRGMALGAELWQELVL
ncbi:MAG: peptidase M20 [Parcubacteria group bacterium Gr01-1014_17]|nr:MAG: peptidase M20 [Parcubacteria group bacterium Gr01-1014_17]